MCVPRFCVGQRVVLPHPQPELQEVVWVVSPSRDEAVVDKEVVVAALAVIDGKLRRKKM